MAIQSVIALFASFSISMSVLETVSGVLDRLRTGETTVEDSEVIEIFKAETVTDLEEAISYGYPMPWLQEILNDETIPEEDRYWLDCRMRAAIAQALHLFFDREGYPVYVEASWIAPGERYWQENMMVRPILPGEETSQQMPDDSDFLDLLAEEARGQTQEAFSDGSPTLMSDPPGKVRNLYGEEVGVLAVVHKNLSLSRDASIGAIQSGGNIDAYWDRTPYACILYSDGSFVENPLEYLGQYRAAVSEDGSTVVFVLTRAPSITAAQQPVDAFFYDRDGNLTGKVTPPEQFSTNYTPQLSPSG